MIVAKNVARSARYSILRCGVHEPRSSTSGPMAKPVKDKIMTASTTVTIFILEEIRRNIKRVAETSRLPSAATGTILRLSCDSSERLKTIARIGNSIEYQQEAAASLITAHAECIHRISNTAQLGRLRLRRCRCHEVDNRFDHVLDLFLIIFAVLSVSGRISDSQPGGYLLLSQTCIDLLL